MKRHEVSASQFLAGQKGGEITCTDHQGQVLWAYGLTSTRKDGKDIASMMAADHQLTLTGSIFAVQNPKDTTRVMPQRNSAAYRTGAGEFTPSLMSESEKRLRRLGNEINARASALEAKMAAISKMTPTPEPQTPTAPPEPEPEVIDDGQAQTDTPQTDTPQTDTPQAV